MVHLGAVREKQAPAPDARPTSDAAPGRAPRRDALRGKGYDEQVQLLAPDAGSGQAEAGGALFGHHRKDKKQAQGAGAPAPALTPADQKKAAQAKHADAQARLDAVIRKGLAATPKPGAKPLDGDVVLRNACQWIESGKGHVVALTPTHDSETRDPKQGLAMFDPSVAWPAAGGDYPLDPATTTDPRLCYTTGEDGYQEGDTLYVVGHPSEAKLRHTLVHEVQHQADDHEHAPAEVGDESWGGGVAMYASEYRAYFLQDAQTHRFGDLTKPAQNDGFIYKGAVKRPGQAKAELLDCHVETHFANEVQENIFHHLRTTAGYEWVAARYTVDDAFRKAVDAATMPSSVNLVDSPRVADLLQALGACKPALKAKAPELAAVHAAAAALDAYDRSFLADAALARPFWERAKAALSAKELAALEASVR
ncbi:MAG: hypothetical protein U1F43_22450 [Myxococcota bacterium]